MRIKEEIFDKFSKEIQEAKNIEKVFEIIESIDKIDNVDEREKGPLLVEAEKWITDEFDFNKFNEESLEIIQEAEKDSWALGEVTNLIDKLSRFQERLYKYNANIGLTHENKDMKSLIEQIQTVTELSINAKKKLVEDNTLSFKTMADYKAEEEKRKKVHKKDLKETIEELIEKIENEPNAFKREMYMARIKRLKEKMDKEIAIRKIKEDSTKKMNELEDKKGEALDRKIQNTIANKANINYSEGYIDNNRRYDYDSEDFMFNKKDVESKGGLEGFIKYLEDSGNSDFKDVAKKIKEVESEKSNLDGYYAAEDSNQKKDIEKEYRKAAKTVRNEEKSLIRKEKGSIFSKIGNFFKNVSNGIKKYFEEKKAVQGEVKSIYNQRAKKAAEDIRSSLKVDINDWSAHNQSKGRTTNRSDKEQEVK